MSWAAVVVVLCVFVWGRGRGWGGARVRVGRVSDSVRVHDVCMHEFFGQAQNANNSSELVVPGNESTSETEATSS